MKFITKNAVDIRGIKPELLFGLMIIDGVFDRNEVTTRVVTSVTDGTHMKGSLHYAGMAVDLRLPYPAAEKNKLHQLVQDMQNTLGVQWDVVLEETHIHVEFDPKPATFRAGIDKKPVPVTGSVPLAGEQH